MTSRMKVLMGLAIAAFGLGVGAMTMTAQQHPSSEPPDNDQAFTVLSGNGDQAWLGVTLKDVTADQARELKLGGEYGALVTKVTEDSPASKAGLQDNDVVVEFSGEKVHSKAELSRMVRETPPGRAVEIKVRRNGESKTLTATLNNRHSEGGPFFSMNPGNFRFDRNFSPDLNLTMPLSLFGGPRLGVSVDELTPQLADFFGVKDGNGLLVREVGEGSAAERAGIKAGDCIVRIDSKPVKSADDIQRILGDKHDQARDVAVTVVRDRKEQTLQVHIAAPARQRLFNESAELMGRDAALLRGQLGTGDLERETGELRRQLLNENGELQRNISKLRDEAVRAANDHPELRQQWLKDRGQWQEEMRKLRPEMDHLRQQIDQLRQELNSEV